MAQFNMESMLDVMDELFKEYDVALSVSMPSGTFDAIVTDNIGNIATVQFFIILNAMSSVLKEMCEDLAGDDFTPQNKEAMVNGLLDLVKTEVLKEDQ